jgi:signal transduction histidine kinase
VTNAPPISSPLLLAAVSLIDDGATAAVLVDRFAAAGATVQPDTAKQLLAQLAQLGFARIGKSVDGEPRYVVTSIGRKHMERSELGETEADRLAELERLRTDLLSTIAHELRTPLTAVRTSVGLLLDPEHEPDPDQRSVLLATIERNADRMQRLVGDILDLARFRAGGVTLQLRRFDARQLAEAAVASIEPLAAAAEQRIVADLPRVPVWVYGDYRRLEQAVVNLLSNAQRFSPQGEEIRVRVESGDSEVAWHVRDYGPGIEPADQARLFERFFVGRNDRSVATAGVGLGLPTTLAIAQAHGGRVDVDSRPGEGSTFTVAVPAAGPEETAES